MAITKGGAVENTHLSYGPPYGPDLATPPPPPAPAAPQSAPPNPLPAQPPRNRPVGTSRLSAPHPPPIKHYQRATTPQRWRAKPPQTLPGRPPLRGATNKAPATGERGLSRDHRACRVATPGKPTEA